MSLVAVFAVVVAPGALAGSERKLPPESLRGPAHLLDQYPAVSLATPAQRAAAVRLLAEMRSSAARWRSTRAAAAAGFSMHRARRHDGNRTAMLWFHAEHRRFSNDTTSLDPQRPETLVYADIAGRPLVLIGVMFAMPRGKLGPTPGGPITRWHSHVVCARGAMRGLAPRADGSCPPGTKRRLGSEMLHVWFTRDLRSAFAIHAPEPELCVARLIPRNRCHGTHDHAG